MSNRARNASGILTVLLFAHGYLTPLLIFIGYAANIHPGALAGSETTAKARLALVGWLLLALAFTAARFFFYRAAQQAGEVPGIFGKWLLVLVASSPLVILLNSLDF